MNIIKNLCAIGAILFGLYLAFTFNEPRNGILILSNKQTIEEIKVEQKNKVKTTDLYKVKITEDNGRSVLIMDQKTAKAIALKGVLREGENSNFLDSNPIYSLPAIKNNDAILFADNSYQNQKEIKIGDKELTVSYEGNTWFGHYRDTAYEEVIVIVKNTIFDQIPVEEIDMGILELNKVYGNNNGIVDTNIPKSVNAEKEFTRIFESHSDSIKFSQGLSIIN
ncbi:lipoprotein BA_5634 family protein [Lysinibacillus xylanilyticus]|uniref:lipoprotein BA_5634 family protein n=1 Tax=Lysinibacillus xylanilyticus TaxID=582475 RepID=UPI002E225798|nr:lipoprotein BA_5634 family protein [Lysinibacillus xylanilyticus]